MIASIVTLTLLALIFLWLTKDIRTRRHRPDRDFIRNPPAFG